MHEAVPIQAPEPPQPTTWLGVLHGVAVWLVIAGLTAFFAYKSTARPKEAAAPGAGNDVGLRLQGRVLVGSHELGWVPEEEAVKQARAALKEHPARLAVLVGEFSGPDEALAELNKDRGDEALAAAGGVLLVKVLQEEKKAKVVETALLRKLYEAQRPDALTEKEQARLREQLGWYGDLALAGLDEDDERHAEIVADARLTVVVGSVFLGCAVLGLLTGVFILLVVVGLAASGHITPAIQPGRSLVYAETFALYMAGYLGLSYLVRWLVLSYGLENWVFGLMGAAMLLSLLALAWPLLRGVTWSEMSQDVGLYTRSPLADIAAGVGTYLSALPLVAMGLIVVLLLVLGARRLGFEVIPPSHPVGNMAEAATPWWVWAQVVVVAAVLAPIVEEIFFRGTLYMHLRRLVPLWSALPAFLFAAAVSSFVFAIIHPQGWLGVPVLSALAGVFCLAREVRGSLLPCMVAHGINNFVAMLLLMFVLS